MTATRERTFSALRALPSLTAATTAMFGCASLLLVLGAVAWQPGKNPRWIIVSLAIVSVLFVVWALKRGPGFTRAEALGMASIQLFAIGCLTWTTHLPMGAFANGTVMPIIGVYVTWFLHPIAGRIVLFFGAAWWFVAILHQDRPALIPFAITLLAQTIIAIEVLSRVKARMDRVARTDALTGTLNRLGVTEVIQRELSRASRKDESLCVVAVDLDGLRTVNNTLGHLAGDRLLESSSRHWSQGMRRRDSIGRVGGDEFLFVLPSTTPQEADQMMRRLAEASPGAWSAGIAKANRSDTFESILERADRRMYVQKAARRSAEVPR